jgi:predicted nucleotidyltransferase
MGLFLLPFVKGVAELCHARTISSLMDPLARIFGSYPRLKLLRLFLFNDGLSVTSAEAAFRTKTPKDAARKELNVLAAAGVVRKRSVKNTVCYTANPRFPYFLPLQEFLRDTTSVDEAGIIAMLKRAGSLRLVVLSGMFSGAVESKIDLLVVGDKLDDKTLDSNVHKLEAELGRELRFACFTTEDFRYRVGVYDRLIRDVLDFPHRVLVDKIGIQQGGAS